MSAVIDPRRLVSLEGQVALITGAASGIGRAQCELFLAAGARVIAVDTNGQGLASLAAENAEGLLTQVANLADASQVQATVEAALAHFGQIDILCNTAGVLDGFSRSLDTDEALWDKVFAVNLKAIYRLTNAVLPQMLARGQGVILNMASIAGQFAAGGGAAYTASKHAVLGYTRQMAHDYGRRGIRVNAVCPGMIETGMTGDVLADPASKLMKVLTGVPAGRLGRAEDIAQVSLFLAGPGADFIHGAAITVDGGLTIK